MSDNPYQSPETSDAGATNKSGAKDRLLAWIVYLVLAGTLLMFVGMGLVALFIFALSLSNM